MTSRRVSNGADSICFRLGAGLIWGKIGWLSTGLSDSQIFAIIFMLPFIFMSSIYGTQPKWWRNARNANSQLYFGG